MNRRQLLSFDALKKLVPDIEIRGPWIDMDDPRDEPAYLYKIMFTMSRPVIYRLEVDGSRHRLRDFEPLGDEDDALLEE